MSAPPIEASGLVKRYGDLTAVDHIDLSVREGDVYGYLGPNGAGKTTSLRMLLGLIRPDAGSARLFGRDPLEEGARALDGVAGFVEAPRFYPYLTGLRNLQLVAALDGDGAEGRIGEALDTVELADRAGDKVGGYSHGMRQRLGIAGALLRAPRLLLLDEPTTGLDPAGMRDMRRLIRRLADQGITVLLSSAPDGRGRGAVRPRRHRARRAQGLRGRPRRADRRRRRALRPAHDGRRPGRRDRARPARRSPTWPAGEHGEVTFAAGEAAASGLSLALAAEGVGIVALVPQRASLEELFFRMTEEVAA